MEKFTNTQQLDSPNEPKNLYKVIPKPLGNWGFWHLFFSIFNYKPIRSSIEDMFKLTKKFPLPKQNT